MANVTKVDIVQSLMEQLHAKRVRNPHFEDLVRDYGEMWDAKRGLALDIQKRGAIVPANAGPKPNPAIKELAATNKQMLALLKELGLTIEDSQATGDDGDDAL